MRSVFLLLLSVAFSLNAQGQDAAILPGAGGLQIKTWHYKPAGDESPKPVVIALHGCGGLYATSGTRKGQLNARHHGMGQMLAAEGYHVIFPDSFGSRGIEGICSEAQRLKNGIRVDMPERRADTLATLAWVRAQAWADTQRNNIALLGWSNGAQAVLASTDSGNAAVNASGAAFKTAIAFYPGCVQASRTGYRPNTSLMLLLGADDDWTLPEPCIKLGEKLTLLGDAVTVKVYPGAVHGFDTPVPGVRSLSDIPSRSPNRTGHGVQTGQHPAAFDDSWRLVRETLAKAFKSP